MNRSLGIVTVLSVGAIVILGVSLFVLQSGGPGSSSPNTGGGDNEGKTTLTFYCAAGIRKPVEAVIKDYADEFGISVQPTYAGSGALLSKIRSANLGDLYLAASISYMNDGRKLNLVDEVTHVAKQNVVFVVRKDDERTDHIKTFDDIVANSKKARIYIADPKVAAISRAASKMLGKEKWDKVWNAKVGSVDTVNMVANGIITKIGDIGIVWDATANQYEKLRAIRIPEFEAKQKQIAISVLRTSKQPTEALRFMRYLSARDKGLKRFKEKGYRIVDGDKWGSRRPVIKVFAGGLNRPAIEKIIDEFQIREGVKVEATYSGCGILVGQMKGGTIPDMYFACDTTFMEKVKEHFPKSTDVSGTEMVIIVSKEKQKKLQVKTLADLAKPKRKIGICSEDHSALGFLSQRLLEKHKLQQAVQKNIADSPATADVLVTQVVAGALDAAIVYKANTSRRVKDLAIISIDDPLANAVQPIAVADKSDFSQLSKRLMDKINSEEAKQRFEELGFRWLGEAQKK